MTAPAAPKILIAGAGPTGLACALELARRGFALRIVDKGAGFTPVEQSRALGVNNRTLQLLQPSGVTDKLLAKGTRATHLRIRNEKGRDVIRTPFAYPGVLYPFMLVLAQGRTERLLGEALNAHGVSIEWNTQVTDANGDALRPEVRLTGPGGAESVSADIVIGADGPGSQIRKSFGFSFEGSSLATEFGLADVDLGDAIDTEELFVHFNGADILARIPMGGKTVRYISPRANISKALPDDLKIERIVWRSSFHINFRHVEQMARGRVFLAGDAAHVHSPVGARGMNLGIEDACWLAWAIEAGKTGDYSGLRMPVVRKVVTQTRTQTRALLGFNSFTRFLRDHAANALLSVPFIRAAAFKGVTGLDTIDPPWLKQQC
ncbi:FAD-dependent oxidoreductase [Hyphococcus sp.]|uniref:FAD-dependent oxidoreductase n=1 Tax=Hyphococcus sp. TaxID=2038636 RepID=UPI003CCB931B